MEDGSSRLERFKTSRFGNQENGSEMMMGKEEAAELVDVSIENDNENPAQSQEDFNFIDEELTKHMEEIQQNEAVLQKVQRAVEKGKKKIPQELQETTIDEVKNLEENFHKVIGYAQILMDSVRKFQNQANEAQAHNMQLESNLRQMNQQVMFMKEDWKRE